MVNLWRAWRVWGTSQLWRRAVARWFSTHRPPSERVDRYHRCPRAIYMAEVAVDVVERGEGLAPSTCLFYNGYVSWKNGGVVMIT